MCAPRHRMQLVKRENKIVRLNNVARGKKMCFVSSYFNRMRWSNEAYAVVFLSPLFWKIHIEICSTFNSFFFLSLFACLSFSHSPHSSLLFICLLNTHSPHTLLHRMKGSRVVKGNSSRYRQMVDSIVASGIGATLHEVMFIRIYVAWANSMKTEGNLSTAINMCRADNASLYIQWCTVCTHIHEYWRMICLYSVSLSAVCCVWIFRLLDVMACTLP